MLGTGEVKAQSVSLGAARATRWRSRQFLGEDDDAAHDFSAKVETTNGTEIIAERPMYFAYRGAWTGGHVVVGALEPAGTFYFAEGTCRPGFDPYICVQNPGSAPANVNITYMLGDGSSRSQSVTVGGNTRSTVEVKQQLGEGNDAAHDFSAKVEAAAGAR